MLTNPIVFVNINTKALHGISVIGINDIIARDENFILLFIASTHQSMASLLTDTLPWHDGEIQMRSLLRIPPIINPTVPSLSYGATYLLLNSPLLAIGAVDREGRPWSTLWGGEVGFAKPTSQSKIEIRTPVDSKHDPLADILLHNSSGESGQLVSGLVVDLATRKRAKLFGRKITGSIQVDEENHIDSSRVGFAHLLVQIEASLGKNWN